MIFMTDWHGSTYCSLIIGGARLMHGPFSKILGARAPPAPQDRRPCMRQGFQRCRPMPCAVWTPLNSPVVHPSQLFCQLCGVWYEGSSDDVCRVLGRLVHGWYVPSDNTQYLSTIRYGLISVENFKNIYLTNKDEICTGKSSSLLAEACNYAHCFPCYIAC